MNPVVSPAFAEWDGSIVEARRLQTQLAQRLLLEDRLRAAPRQIAGTDPLGGPAGIPAPGHAEPGSVRRAAPLSRAAETICYRDVADIPERSCDAGFPKIPENLAR